jgi:hypothetical protein
MNSANLLLDQITLQFGILLGVAVPASLIVLTAVVDPYALRNESSAHLIASKDVGDGLSRL